MDGVELYPSRVIIHPKGDILHAIKASSEGFDRFGEVYFSTIKHGEIKGWKKHTKMVLNFLVPVGEVQFVIYNGSNFFTIILSKENYQRLTIAPNLWVAFKGVSENTNLILNVASIEHDPDEAVNVDLEKISYDWR